MGEGSKFSVLTSQLGSIENNKSADMYGYRMSKAAANMACKNLSVDNKESGITVLMLHPGYVKTDMTGHRGNITSLESAKGLKELVMSKDLNDTGTFWHVNGKELPW